jgi:uncharacterized oxidoreductase
MITTGNTVLITGGGSGIGFETANAFLKKGNTVILTGRNKQKLQHAADQLKGAHYFVADITDEESIDALVEYLTLNFPEVNILMNNAGLAYAYRMFPLINTAENAKAEITTNYISNIQLTGKMLPLLITQKNAAIINNSSVTAIVPGAIIPTYSASKAALHSYTQSLRHYLHKETAVRVFEIMPPLTDTEFSKSLPGEKMHPTEIAQVLLQGLENDQYEIYPGVASQLYQLYLKTPEAAFSLLNKTV